MIISGEKAAAALLDNPVWSALTMDNKAFAIGGLRAWRYQPEVGPFGAVLDRTAPSFEALVALVRDHGRTVLHTPDAIPAPAGLMIGMQAPILQMILTVPAVTRPGGPDHVVLASADVPAMMDLAARTKPGPFGSRTSQLGRYIGLHSRSALVAMAGERMRFDRFVEISAVCVDPDHRGKGYAALLMMRLAQDLQARGLTPFLHVFDDNAGAIALYEKLGFVTRGRFYVTALGVDEAASAKVRL